MRQSPQQTKVCTPKLRIDKYCMRNFGVQPEAVFSLFKATDVYVGGHGRSGFYNWLSRIRSLMHVKRLSIEICSPVITVQQKRCEIA